MRSDTPDDDALTLPDAATAARGGSGPAPVPAAMAEVSAADPTLAQGQFVTLAQSEADATAVPGAPPAHGAPPVRGEPPVRGVVAAGVPAGAASEPQVFANRFEVIALLGQGGMGRVYSVRDRHIEGRAVALKLLLPKYSRNENFRKLFFQEIRAAQKFVNEHVVQVRDCGQMDDGHLFVTMDLVRGESLRDLLAREHALRPRHALEIARQTLLALQSGHEQGFVHRDIKPANLMLSAGVAKTDENPYGVAVRVLDFGLAGLAADLDDGKLAGTPMYMSPEQVQGQRLDARSDLFAVGVALFEMFSGRRPFGGSTVAEITSSVIETNVAPMISELKDVSAPIRKILEKALQKDREKRFQSAAEFIHAIEKSSAYKLPTLMPAWTWAALAVLAVAIVVEGVVLSSKIDRIQQLEDERFKSDPTKVTAVNQRVGELDRKVDLENAEQDNRVLQGRLTDKDGTISQLQRDKEALATELAAELEKNRVSESTITELRRINGDTDSNLKTSEGLREQAVESYNKLFDEKTELARENAKLRQQLPAARQSATFDQILGHLGDGDEAQARSAYEQSLNAGTFQKPLRDGTDLIAELVNASVSMAAFGASLDSGARPGMDSLGRANVSLQAVYELQPGFRVASPWLDFGDRGPGESAKHRLEQLDEVIERLSGRIQSAMTSVTAYDQTDWTRICRNGPDQEPADAITHSLDFKCAHLAELANACLAAAATSIEKDGYLDVMALADATHLASWGRHVAGGSAGIGAEDGRALVLFWYAQRWYDDDDTNDADFDRAWLRPPVVQGETHEWQAVLALQHALANSKSFPFRDKHVYHFDDGSKLCWRVDVLRSKSADSHGPWELERSEYQENLTPLPGQDLSNVVTYQRTGMTYTKKGSSEPLLDLKACDGSVWVDRFPDLTAPPPPQNLVSQDLMTDFRSALDRDAGACLVYKRGSRTRWYSPAFGVVLDTFSQAGQETNRIELVFSTPSR